MKIKTKYLTTCLVAAVIAVTATTARGAAPTAPELNGQISLRPLTPQDKKDYSVTTLQIASGLSTVGIGQPVYLDALVNIAIATSNITSVTWSLTNKPAGSAAVLETSPLGTNVPTYKMADRLTLKVAGRQMLRPDLAGQYTVLATIVSVGDPGTTNLTKVVTNRFTQAINAGSYMGAQTCALCHSGGALAEDTYEAWMLTHHATAFTNAIDGWSTDHFSQNCISCHVVGYDTNTNANNGGFDDIALTNGWTMPAHATNGNYAAMPAALRRVSNIQCENCHGAGSLHAYTALVDTNLAKQYISVTMAAGDCAQCHDSLSHHFKTAEWANSRHAVATRTPSGSSRFNCVRCHTAPGFKQFIENSGSTNQYTTNTVYEAITCAACHDPHDATNPHQLRAAPIITLPEGTTVTNAGLGALCMQCHHSRNGSVSNNIANFRLGLPTWANGSSFGVHDSTAGDMIEGVNGMTYNQFIPSGSHSSSITNVCVGCHMQPVESTDPAFTKAGGHTFSMTYTMVTNGVTNVIAKTDVCVKCHGEIEDFDMVRKDYNGDGVIEGIQTEVQKLLDKLSAMLPYTNYVASGNYVPYGSVQTTLNVRTNWQLKYQNAAWNWQFVGVEGSHGIHNAPYAVGLLKASIADLTGDSNNDGLPDAWQIQYFGSTTTNTAAPNASPAGDGIPNWVKYSLGLNPLVRGVVLPDGVVWMNNNNMVGSTNGNTLKIYTAAEIAFDTQIGTTYQIQGASSLSGGWQNIGSPIAGTGGSASYVTPMRNNAQMFFRVSHTP